MKPRVLLTSCGRLEMQGFAPEFVGEYIRDTGMDQAFNVGEYWTDLKCAQMEAYTDTFLMHRSQPLLQWIPRVQQRLYNS